MRKGAASSQKGKKGVGALLKVVSPAAPAASASSPPRTSPTGGSKFPTIPSATKLKANPQDAPLAEEAEPVAAAAAPDGDVLAQFAAFEGERQKQVCAGLVALCLNLLEPEVLLPLLRAVASEEVEAERAAKHARENGLVELRYEMYCEQFAIAGGCLQAAMVDEEYCFSYAMPGCVLHLSHLPSAQRLEAEAAGDFLKASVREDPPGTFRDLEAGAAYHVFAEQLEAQLRRDHQLMAARAREMEGYVDRDAAAQKPQLLKDDGRGFDCCTCSEGTPCTDEYGCKDWGVRFDVACRNGWKGFTAASEDC